MLYESKYADLQVFIRSGSVMYHPATGVEISRVRALIANFGTHGGEFMMDNPLTGQPERHALIHGHFFDSESAAERLGWTPEEHDSVVITLDRLCKQQPFLIAKVEHPEPEIVKPWPTYDETDWRQIPTLAEALGLTQVALAYERENKNRPSVITAMENSTFDPFADTKTETAEPVPAEITLGS